MAACFICVSNWNLFHFLFSNFGAYTQIILSDVTFPSMDSDKPSSECRLFYPKMHRTY